MSAITETGAHGIEAQDVKSAVAEVPAFGMELMMRRMMGGKVGEYAAVRQELEALAAKNPDFVTHMVMLRKK